MIVATYDAPETAPYYAAYYRVRWMGDVPNRGKWEYDDDDDGAGNNREQFDMVEFTICPLPPVQARDWRNDSR